MGIFLFIGVSKLKSQEVVIFNNFLKEESVNEHKIDSLLANDNSLIESDSLSFIYKRYGRWLYQQKKIKKAVSFVEKALSKTDVSDSLNIQKNA